MLTIEHYCCSNSGWAVFLGKSHPGPERRYEVGQPRMFRSTRCATRGLPETRRFAGGAAARNIGSPLDGPSVRNVAHRGDAAPLRQNAAVFSLARG
jgi:hypothetical protein